MYKFNVRTEIIVHKLINVFPIPKDKGFSSQQATLEIIQVIF